MAASSLPTSEQEQELHRRLLAGEKTAPADLAEAYHPAILEFLRKKNPRRLDDDLIADAAFETWASLCKKPTSYDGKGSFWSFLQLSAQRDLLNRLAKETRHRRHYKTGEAVEQWPVVGIALRDDRTDDLERVERDILPVVTKGLTEGQVRCLDLYLAGERMTSAFAAALGIAERPKAEQKVAVKRTKDLLKKRIERARRDHDNAT